MLVGIDEVGRGCWAGPLVAGAVLLDREIPGLRDSKVLSKKRREVLATVVQQEALAFGLGWVSPAEVDELGLTEAVRLAMTRAVADITVEYDEIIIDGNINYLVHDNRARALVKADDLVPAVSAASIIAKVARDAYMEQVSREYPAYGFERHVGYGTKAHSLALARYGITPLHRISYKPVRAFL